MKPRLNQDSASASTCRTQPLDSPGVMGKTLVANDRSRFSYSSSDKSTNYAVHKPTAHKPMLKRLAIPGLFLALLILPILVWVSIDPAIAADITLPGVSFSTGEAVGTAEPDQVGTGLQILAFLTLFSLAPGMLVMVTSFTRVVVVLSFVRQAMGLQGQPPNQVLIALALFVTFFVMGPVFDRAYDNGLRPYLDKQINEEQAWDRVVAPIKSFMLRQTREKDLELFMRLSGVTKAQSPEEVPLRLVVPAFMVSELKTAFQIGFMIYLPFLIVDMVVASVVMSMGMMMLPPLVISMPVKLILFVLVDGWALVVGSLVQSFK